MKNFDLTNLTNLDLGLEGVDHVNISMESTTRLGKILDPYYVKTINIPNYGKFSSVMSYWRYLQSPNKDDKLRKLVLKDLRNYTKETSIYLNRVENLQEHLLVATRIKLNAYPEQKNELVTKFLNSLFVSYNIVGSDRLKTVRSDRLKVYTGYSKLMIQCVDSLKKETLSSE